MRGLHTDVECRASGRVVSSLNGCPALDGHHGSGSVGGLEGRVYTVKDAPWTSVQPAVRTSPPTHSPPPRPPLTRSATRSVAAFNKARGHDLERVNYLEDLRAANWPELVRTAVGECRFSFSVWFSLVDRFNSHRLPVPASSVFRSPFPRSSPDLG